MNVGELEELVPILRAAKAVTEEADAIVADLSKLGHRPPARRRARPSGLRTVVYVTHATEARPSEKVKAA